MSRKNARECAMKLLYEYSITGELINPLEKEEAYSDIYELNLEGDDITYVNQVYSEFTSKQDELDSIISLNSHSWRIERISKVDLAILRLALFEMRYMNIPSKVSINEAVELAKKYSADKSYKYINGLLGGYLKGEVNEA